MMYGEWQSVQVSTMPDTNPERLKWQVIECVVTSKSAGTVFSISVAIDGLELVSPPAKPKAYTATDSAGMQVMLRWTRDRWEIAWVNVLAAQPRMNPLAAGRVIPAETSRSWTRWHMIGRQPWVYAIAAVGLISAVLRLCGSAVAILPLLIVATAVVGFGLTKCPSADERPLRQALPSYGTPVLGLGMAIFSLWLFPFG